MRTLTLALLLATASQLGCVSANSSQDGPVSDRYRITREELLTLPAGTAFDAVDRFHRDWLRRRGATASSSTGRDYPEVFVDGRPFGALDVLHQFGTDSVQEIRFIPPSDATTRYGTGYTGGIIEIILRREMVP